MPIASMTGFSRTEGEWEGIAWAWEAKSVNGKGLDVRCRLAPGLDRLERQVRERVQSRFRRGNISVTLQLSQAAGETAYRINWDLLEELIAAVPEVRERCPDARPPSVDGLLAIRGIVEAADWQMDEMALATFDSALLASLDQTLAALEETRAAEGERLRTVILGQLETIAGLNARAAEAASRQAGLLRERLREGVEALLDASPALTEERLAQEAALLFTKSDVQEELDRLALHQRSAVELIDGGGAIGRKLDFLCQEFNREANTLCSKAAASELSGIGIELKVVIDQMREQVQNVE